MEVGISTDRAGRVARTGAAPAPWARIGLILAALGPGVIGLVANNDAGGMLSYLVTGANRGLEWILPALVLLGLPIVFIQWVALRVAQATGLPYGKALSAAAGRLPARVEAVALYVLNTLILATEFVGMTAALALGGVPITLALPITFCLVVALTSASVYVRIERLLLYVASATLVFFPALMLVHHRPGALMAAFVGPGRHTAFLLLALAGNSIAPWMIYWQQNATWSGRARSQRQQNWDLGIGVVAFMLMAATVILLGAVASGTPGDMAVPLLWLFRAGGAVSGSLFAVGIFDAGLLAACTISLSSLWTLREAVGAGAGDPGAAPNRGGWFAVHLATLAAAAAIALPSHLAAGRMALWVNALNGIWMPVSLTLLGVVAGNRRVMGRQALSWCVRLALWGLAAGFALLAGVGLAGGL